MKNRWRGHDYYFFFWTRLARYIPQRLYEAVVIRAVSEEMKARKQQPQDISLSDLLNGLERYNRKPQ